MMFLYDYPNWLMGTTIVAMCLAVTLAGYWLFRKLWGRDFTESEIGMAMGLVGVIATITSLLLAFSAVSVWEAFNSADASVTDEASDASMLARDLAVYGTPEARTARAAVREYVRIVIDEEWPLMTKSGISVHAWNQIDTIFRDAGALEPKSERDKVLDQEIWGRINDLTRDRRERVHDSESAVPPTLWAVVLLGSGLTFLFTFVLRPNAFHIFVISGLAVAMGLVFFFIMAMDHPFAGKESISHAPFDSMVANMDRWDTNDAAAAAAKTNR